MTTYVTNLLLTALAVEPAAVQLPCEEWATQDFWRTAGVARVRECLAAGCSVHDRFSSYNLTVLHRAAAFSDDPEVISVLVEVGANLEDSSPPTRRTPLHMAARFNSDPEIVRVLLRYGANVNAVNERGRTPLHIAALFNDNPAVVEELARATDVNTRRWWGLRRCTTLPEEG
ncbi:MAG: ankyrin repeat domain-containing protein [Gemmatimonadetes bacterium]|nr:ankyrin repeat domain-containing protein [Gemmatimonadota bacterium]